MSHDGAAGLDRERNHAEQPVKMIDETASRTWYVSENARGKTGTTWYIAVAPSLFEDSTYEATAKQIAKRLK
ncbi:MAG TPA: hypothetical protein VKE70_34975 [Candidatus Solibacter sp.]|nr:hypothetical protein [Candidatus Solibacter sp.]